MARRRTIGFLSFLRGTSDPKDGTPGCANYDHYYGGCLLQEKCNVEEGKRCAYFEKAVLPTAWQIGCGESLLKQYRQKSGDETIGKVKEIKHVEENLCECGEPLKAGN